MVKITRDSLKNDLQGEAIQITHHLEETTTRITPVTWLRSVCHAFENNVTQQCQ